MTYTIECFGSAILGWRYRVVLLAGRVAYRGVRNYSTHQAAERAARATGAAPKEQQQ